MLFYLLEIDVLDLLVVAVVATTVVLFLLAENVQFLKKQKD